MSLILLEIEHVTGNLHQKAMRILVESAGTLQETEDVLEGRVDAVMGVVGVLVVKVAV